jgi:hypothetical protein
MRGLQINLELSNNQLAGIVPSQLGRCVHTS